MTWGESIGYNHHVEDQKCRYSQPFWPKFTERKEEQKIVAESRHGFQFGTRMADALKCAQLAADDKPIEHRREASPQIDGEGRPDESKKDFRQKGKDEKRRKGCQQGIHQ